mgnify:CR=1 FL=1
MVGVIKSPNGYIMTNQINHENLYISKTEKPKERPVEPKNDSNDNIKLKKQLQKQIDGLEKEIERKEKTMDPPQ